MTPTQHVLIIAAIVVAAIVPFLIKGKGGK